MTEPSPYQTPQSKLNENITLPNEGLLINRVASSRGAFWFFDGFKRLFQSPGTWLVIGILNLLILLLLGIVSLVPVIGSFLSYLFYPVLVAGFMYACHMQDTNKISVSDLFSGFSQQTSQLFLCGALYIVMMIGVFIVALLLAVMTIIPMFSELETAVQNNPTEFVLFILLFILVFIALTLPIVMSLWFAPALIILNKLEAIPAIKLSFNACSKNVLPYLIYSVIAIVIYTVIGLLLFFAIDLSANDKLSPVFMILGIILGVLLIIISAPAIFISIYSAYLDLFKKVELEDG